MYFCNMIFRHLLNMRSHPTWVRGLKLKERLPKHWQSNVAPYVGAWIETAPALLVILWMLRRTLRGCVD